MKKPRLHPGSCHNLGQLVKLHGHQKLIDWLKADMEEDPRPDPEPDDYRDMR